MEFKYKMLSFICNCGKKTNKVCVGTTSHGHLIGKWTCRGCNKSMAALISFNDLMAGAPKTEEPKQLPAQSDSDFFKSLGIKDDEENK